MASIRRAGAVPVTSRAEGGIVSPEWAWAWPANRRILYNRASADPQGRPWSERKRYVWWDEQQGRWAGWDVPDFPADKHPDYRPAPDARGMDAIAGTDPFIMMGDGRGWLYSPSGLLDGPLPTFYEPLESPMPNLLYPKLNGNPAAVRWHRPENPYHAAGDPRYPLVATTFRLTEHHTAGGMSRTVPWLVELQPEMFAEIDPQLAADRGIEDGGWMTIVTERAEIEARAKVTDRIRPLRIDGRPDSPDRAAVALGLQRALPRRHGQRACRPVRRSERLDPGRQGVHLRRAGRPPAGPEHGATRGRVAGGASHPTERGRPAGREPARGEPVSTSAPDTEIAIHRAAAQRMGFFTDTTVCIGCKACEVACKQWNDLPADGSQSGKGVSYDHTGDLSASTWRHVRFVELFEPSPQLKQEAQRALEAGAADKLPAIPAAGAIDLVDAAQPASGVVDVADAVRKLGEWVFMSDVCRHCTNAGCLDACPTGALIRTEHQTVVLQPDVCNGCGYCVPACPFGVVDRDPEDGRAGKCTLCYDRLEDGLEPACAKSCPTDSIQFGPHEELVEIASRRVAELHRRGIEGAYLYGAGDEPGEQLAGGLGAFFLLTEPPERYGLPAHADSPVQENVVPATVAAVAAGLLASAGAVLAFVTAARRGRRTPGRGTW